MARSKITSSSQDLISDDGAVLISVIRGEQIHLNLTLNWLANISDYTLLCKVVEADNDGAGTKPVYVANGAAITTLPILEATDEDNQFKLVIPETLGEDWAIAPSPNSPVYGYIDLEIRDTGIGNQQQVWKPFRGLIEIRYSPTEAV
jgi:hypothetical protein